MLKRHVRKDYVLEFEPLDQFQQRLKKLGELKALGKAAYPHKFAWTHTPRQVTAQFGSRDAAQLSAEPIEARVAGGLLR